MRKPGGSIQSAMRRTVRPRGALSVSHCGTLANRTKFEVYNPIEMIAKGAGVELPSASAVLVLLSVC